MPVNGETRQHTPARDLRDMEARLKAVVAELQGVSSVVEAIADSGRLPAFAMLAGLGVATYLDAAADLLEVGLLRLDWAAQLTEGTDL